MKSSVFSKIRNFFHSTNQWFAETPERALDQAYSAALKIKAIEDEHFNGRKISSNAGAYGDSVMSYFQGELRNNLKVAKRRLAEFRASRSFLNGSNQKADNFKGADSTVKSSAPYRLEPRENLDAILEKLKFIDEIIAKYTPSNNLSRDEPSLSLVVAPTNNVQLEANQSKSIDYNDPLDDDEEKDTISKIETFSDSTGVLPRSILRTFNRLTKELNPKAEEDVVRKFRRSQAKTVISLRFILLIIVVPLLTFQLSKVFLVGPVVERYFTSENRQIGMFINQDLEEEALRELTRYEERLKFETLISQTPQLSAEAREEKLRDKAKELEEEYREESTDAVKNVGADLLSLAAFGLVIFNNRRDIAILKSFMDEIVYGLSDSAKAFIIILFTDIFVGYHSPHGWEVLLEGISRHLGLPENRQFIFLFIATFPVILDTIFKYWIFRYLNRISPSAVATYRNMNE